MPKPDLNQMSLRELVALRDEVAGELKGRFERSLALLFTDVVGSTAHVASHGDLAGRDLLTRHHELLRMALEQGGGRLIDTAGDGAFCVADTVAAGADILTQFQRNILASNAGLPRSRRLFVRSGLHRGTVLVDGDFVSGEAVNTAARVMGTGGPGEIRVSDQAFRDLPVHQRHLCRRLEPASVKGIPGPVELLLLDWRDTERFPTAMEVVETGRMIPIPFRNRVRMGRLPEYEGKVANDIVLVHFDLELSKRLSRWHAELEMTTDGYRLRSITRAATEIDGVELGEGDSAPVLPGSVARLGQVLTLRFLTPATAEDSTVFS